MLLGAARGPSGIELGEQVDLTAEHPAAEILSFHATTGAGEG